MNVTLWSPRRWASVAGWELWYAPSAVVTHFGEASSRQAPETMYIQLYRSKVQFYRKFGGEGRARLYKTLIIIAYLPRALAASIVSLARPSWRPQARRYGRLLVEMARM
jgi:GT2 family glycosyltransferase